MKYTEEENLEDLWKKLRLTEEEEEEFTVPKEVIDEVAVWIPNCLLGSLLTAKSYNKEAFKNTIARIWRATPLLKIFEVGDNLFLFQFNSAEEREMVLNGGPWNFDDNLILLKCLEPKDKPGRDLLTTAPFWIQIYGLPFSSMTEKMGFFLGRGLGKVLEVKTDENGLGLGKCLAVRVEIDIRKPLRRRMKVSVSSDSSFPVDLKYERLPEFCYGCGLMGHKEKECITTIRLRKDNPNLPWQYGKWLKAPVRQRFNTNNGQSFRSERQSWRKDEGRSSSVAFPVIGNPRRDEESRGGTQRQGVGDDSAVLCSISPGLQLINEDIRDPKMRLDWPVMPLMSGKGVEGSNIPFGGVEKELKKQNVTFGLNIPFGGAEKELKKQHVTFGLSGTYGGDEKELKNQHVTFGLSGSPTLLGMGEIGPQLGEGPPSPCSELDPMVQKESMVVPTGPAEDSAHCDMLFGEMDIVVQSVQTQRDFGGPVTEIKGQGIPSSVNRKYRKIATDKKKGKENSCPELVRSGNGKRERDVVEEIEEQGGHSAKKRVLGEIPSNIMVEAVNQPHRSS